jgi:hypothetical protein
LKKRRVKLSGTVRVKVFPIVADRIQAAARLAANRCFKHTSRPTADLVENVVYETILNELCEIFEFSSDGDEYV